MSDRSTEMTLPAGGPAHGARVRAHHDVVLRVLDGVVVLVADDDELVLTPYDEVTIPAGTQHRYWNAGDEEARVVATAVWRWRAASRLLTVRHRPPQPAAMTRREVSGREPELVRRRVSARIATA
jgi:mannose-6-phosphate isomerase-like protein (cupin superfamily)